MVQQTVNKFNTPILLFHAHLQATYYIHKLCTAYHFTDNKYCCAACRMLKLLHGYRIADKFLPSPDAQTQRGEGVRLSWFSIITVKAVAPY